MINSIFRFGLESGRNDIKIIFYVVYDSVNLTMLDFILKQSKP